MINQKKLHQRIAALQVQKRKALTEMAELGAQPVPNEMARHRILARIRRIEEEMQNLQSQLIPDIIA